MIDSWRCVQQRILYSLAKPSPSITSQCLLPQYRYAVPGAIAYARTTNRAETVFIAHQVRFDASTGHPALVYRQTTQVSAACLMYSTSVIARNPDRDF
jgi:hypothetical protein